MTATSSLPSSFVVVLLDDLWIAGDLVPKGEVLAVDRPLRNDWIGSKLARDATEEEAAAEEAKAVAAESKKAAK